MSNQGGELFQGGTEQIRVNRGRMDSITVYDVTDQELRELERGGDGGLYLNFALSLASIAISFLIALATTTISSDRQFTVFVVIAIVSLVAAAVLLVVWWNCRKSVRQLVTAIKARIHCEEGIDDEPSPET